VFGRIADALIVRRMNGKSLEEGLNNFKLLVRRAVSDDHDRVDPLSDMES
jgi:hypothetical protein